VFIFFMLSGFMVSDSASRTGDLLRFTIKRAARILPLFVVCNTIVLALVCPLFADEGAVAFITHRSTWSELANVLTFQTDVFYLGDVSFYAPAGEIPNLEHVVNGVLWTIRLEITCYVFVALVWALGLLDRAGAAVAVLSIVVLLYLATRTEHGLVQGLALCAPSFAAGMIMRELAKRHRPRLWPAIACLAALVLLALGWRVIDGAPAWDQVGRVVFPVLMIYPLLYCGFLEWPWLQRVRALGDPSYGMYLWGWPIQQVLRSVAGGGWSGYAFAALCVPIALGMGYLSWFVLERPVLSLARGPRRVGAALGSDAPAA
jgi:peptidoglycan/LPS O-acetylase OafA/YrhL